MSNIKKILPNLIDSGDLSIVGDLEVAGNIAGTGVNVTGKLEVGDSLTVDQHIYHKDDPNTFINFLNDRVKINAGGINYIDCDDSSSAPHNLTINDGGNNVDVHLRLIDRTLSIHRSQTMTNLTEQYGWIHAMGKCF